MFSDHNEKRVLCVMWKRFRSQCAVDAVDSLKSSTCDHPVNSLWQNIQVFSTSDTLVRLVNIVIIGAEPVITPPCCQNMHCVESRQGCPAMISAATCVCGRGTQTAATKKLSRAKLQALNKSAAKAWSRAEFRWNWMLQPWIWTCLS